MTAEAAPAPVDWAPSFLATRHPQRWHAALYALREGIGPELVSYCNHRHRTMRQATECAERGLLARIEAGLA